MFLGHFNFPSIPEVHGQSSLVAPWTLAKSNLWVTLNVTKRHNPKLKEKCFLDRVQSLFYSDECWELTSQDTSIIYGSFCADGNQELSLPYHCLSYGRICLYDKSYHFLSYGRICLCFLVRNTHLAQKGGGKYLGLDPINCQKNMLTVQDLLPSSPPPEPFPSLGTFIPGVKWLACPNSYKSQTAEGRREQGHPFCLMYEWSFACERERKEQLCPFPSPLQPPNSYGTCKSLHPGNKLSWYWKGLLEEVREEITEWFLYSLTAEYNPWNVTHQMLLQYHITTGGFMLMHGFECNNEGQPEQTTARHSKTRLSKNAG